MEIVRTTERNITVTPETILQALRLLYPTNIDLLGMPIDAHSRLTASMSGGHVHLSYRRTHRAPSTPGE